MESTVRLWQLFASGLLLHLLELALSCISNIHIFTCAEYMLVLNLLSTQATVNELEVVIDESNVQISSLRQQLDGAQQRLDTAEADVSVLQGNGATLKV